MFRVPGFIDARILGEGTSRKSPLYQRAAFVVKGGLIFMQFCKKNNNNNKNNNNKKKTGKSHENKSM